MKKLFVMSKNQGGQRTSALQDLKQIVIGWPYFVCSSICKIIINIFFFLVLQSFDRGWQTINIVILFSEKQQLN